MTQFAPDYAGRSAKAVTAGKSEKPIYYRKPTGWITVNDQISGSKLRDFSYRGFEPLWDFGAAMPADSKGDPIHDNIWATILLHPKGPAMFPIEQIVTYGWYREPPVPCKFPQLAGAKIREFRCPECDRRPFVELRRDGKVILPAIRYLGNHLRIMHRWDRTNLLSYGESVGVNFNEIDSVTDIVTEWNPEPAPVVQDDFEIEEVVDNKRCVHCDWTVDTESKNPSASLRMHIKSRHPEVGLA